MDFRVRDPNREIAWTEGAVVEFWDVANALPQFLGFVQSWTLSGIVERTLDVHCIGAEAVLDWMLVPSLTIPAGTRASTAIQAAAANATGIGFPLRALSDEGLNGYQGNQAMPIAAFATLVDSTDLVAAVTLAGETLREAIRKIFEASLNEGIFVGSGGVTGQVTVDFTYGLRAWATGTTPEDYINTTVAEVIGGLAATTLDHETDALGVVHQVYVKGGNAAGTGLVTDGRGIPGPVALIEDSSITTAAAKQAAGVAYLEQSNVATRGSFTLENFAPTSNVRAGSWITITSTPAGLSAQVFTIASIAKTFIVNKQTWRVAYGGLPLSPARLIRRLTRFVRS
jgi:hypothetical protein